MVVTPGPSTDFEARCRVLCPRFRALETLPARKSEVLAGEVDGQAVVAKRLARAAGRAQGANNVWGWYYAREVAIYRAFAMRPPPFRVPALVAADDDVLIVERVPGEPLARRRSPQADVDVTQLLATRAQIATYGFPETPPPAVRAQLRARFLEDPTDPHWIRDGISRAAKRALLPFDFSQAIDDATAPSHGDLLLRNVVGGVLVDWECAGLHLVDWDLALLSIQLAPARRAEVERAARSRSFLALVAFALAREVSFLRSFAKVPRHGSLQRITGELADVCKRLR